MNRRQFLAGVGLWTACILGGKKLRKYVFKIRKESGQVLGNIAYSGYDEYEAKSKLRKRYPNCEILSVKVRE